MVLIHMIYWINTNSAFLHIFPEKNPHSLLKSVLGLYVSKTLGQPGSLFISFIYVNRESN